MLHETTLELPSPYDPALTLGRLTARLGDATQALEGGVWRKARRLPSPHRLVVRFEHGRARVTASGPLPAAGDLARMVGAHGDWTLLEAAAGRDAVLARLVAASPGLRAFVYEDPFEALAATVFGQQVTLALAARQRGAFLRRFGIPVGDGLWAHPSPEAVLAAPDLAGVLALTRVKAGALQSAAQMAKDGLLDAVRAGAKPLSALRVTGIGPWTLAWFAVHGLGDLDADLVGDLGVRRAIALAHGLSLDDGAAVARLQAERHRPVRAWVALYYLHGWARGLLPGPGGAAQRGRPPGDGDEASGMPRRRISPRADSTSAEPASGTSA